MILSQNDVYVEWMSGIARVTAERSDPAFVSVYYSATVRVEEESGDERLTNRRWFFDSLPEVRRLWQAGKLVSGGTPAPD